LYRHSDDGLDEYIEALSKQIDDKVKEGLSLKEVLDALGQPRELANTYLKKQALLSNSPLVSESDLQAVLYEIESSYDSFNRYNNRSVSNKVKPKDYNQVLALDFSNPQVLKFIIKFLVAFILAQSLISILIVASARMFFTPYVERSVDAIFILDIIASVVIIIGIIFSVAYVRLKKKQ